MRLIERTIQRLRGNQLNPNTLPIDGLIPYRPTPNGAEIIDLGGPVRRTVVRDPDTNEPIKMVFKRLRSRKG